MAQPSKQRTRKLNLRERHKRISKTPWFKNAYENMSVGEAMQIADEASEDEVDSAPVKVNKSKPKQRKPIKKTVDSASNYNVDGRSLNFGGLFNSIRTQKIGEVNVLNCPDVFYMEKLTGGKTITVGQAKEIADKLKFMADSINQQVYETLESRKRDKSRQELVDILNQATNYVLVGSNSLYDYIVPHEVCVTSNLVRMSGVVVIKDGYKTPVAKQVLVVDKKIGTFERTFSLDDVSIVNNPPGSPITLNLPFGRFVMSEHKTCLPEIRQIVRNINKMLLPIKKPSEPVD